MIDFSKHSHVLEVIKDAQKAEKDEREDSREADNFLNKKDGQWEPEVYQQFKKAGKPRYTLDKTNPVVSQIAGAIKLTNFGIKVSPANNNAKEDQARILAGLIRNIQRMSDFKYILGATAKGMVSTGIDGWMITQDWSDTESFNQDLFLRYIPSFVDSVWLDPNSMRQDRSDAMWGVKLTAMTKAAYEKKFPKGSGKSIDQDRSSNAYSDKPEQIIVGDFFYVTEVPTMLHLMSDGSVYSDEDIEKYKDQLDAKGITVERSRKRTKRVVKTRQMDGGGWLSEPRETVFSWVPLIPCYGNFRVTENKITYRGIVERLMDAQRIYNYSRSRQIEEGALARRDKIMITPEQAEGHESALETMNTNSDAVQYYNHIPDQPNPFPLGTSQPNPALEISANSSAQDIIQAAGVFAANMGDDKLSARSGIAIEMLQERGDVSTVEYFEAMEIAINHTCRILVDAIPRIYDGSRTVKILGEDASFEDVNINQVVVGPNGQPVVLNDLSVGRYTVACEIGKSFKSRQQEAVSSILEMANYDPTIIQDGSDILLKNTNAVGLDLLADRRRAKLFAAGEIPSDQWTDEEAEQFQQQQIAAQQQPPQPDPMMIAAMAEQTKADADLLAEQNKQQSTIISAQLKQEDQALKAAELQFKAQAQQQKFAQDDRQNDIKIIQDQQRFEVEQQTLQQKLMLALEENQRANQRLFMDMQKDQQEIRKMQADTLNALKSVVGADVVISPSVDAAFQGQANELAVDTQEVNEL